MPVYLFNSDLGLVTLLSILAAHEKSEAQTKPYLLRDGVKIIL